MTPCWMSRLALMLAIVAGATANSAQAEGWLFRRSYYSHNDSPGFNGGEVPVARSAYREAVAGGRGRFSIRGGYRYNSIVIPNGNGFDRTVIRENWVDLDN